jgi:hypothetical protein|tara:strand:+ start:1301 stop:1930 length:630 start_codon:yes stop_codon:yes gene_type:complete
MPWAFYNASGQRLSSAATNISLLDIDGATDIGAAIVDADLFIVDDNASGTNRKTAASRIKTYVNNIVQVKSVTYSANASTTTTIPADNTIPQVGEGGQFMSLAITPNNTNNRLIILVNIYTRCDGATDQATAALFKDGASNALAGTSGRTNTANLDEGMSFTYEAAAGGTSEQTWTVRAGQDTSGTFNFNSNARGAIIYSSIHIWEVLV